ADCMARYLLLSNPIFICIPLSSTNSIQADPALAYPPNKNTLCLVYYTQNRAAIPLFPYRPKTPPLRAENPQEPFWNFLVKKRDFLSGSSGQSLSSVL